MPANNAIGVAVSPSSPIGLNASRIEDLRQAAVITRMILANTCTMQGLTLEARRANRACHVEWVSLEDVNAQDPAAKTSLDPILGCFPVVSEIQDKVSLEPINHLGMRKAVGIEVIEDVLPHCFPSGVLLMNEFGPLREDLRESRRVAADRAREDSPGPRTPDASEDQSCQAFPELDQLECRSLEESAA